MTFFKEHPIESIVLAFLVLYFIDTLFLDWTYHRTILMDRWVEEDEDGFDDYYFEVDYEMQSLECETEKSIFKNKRIHDIVLIQTANGRLTGRLLCKAK